MASLQTAYVTAVPDDYDVETSLSPTSSKGSASSSSSSLLSSDWGLFDGFAWPHAEVNGSVPYTVDSSQPRSRISLQPSSFDSVPITSHHSQFRSHSHPTSVLQSWQRIITSNACPQSLAENPKSLNEITNELSQREQIDARNHRTPSQHAYDEEQRRRLAWAIDMILTRPKESAEACVALRKAR